MSDFKKEMKKYEVMDETLLINGDRLKWWKKHEETLPLLAIAAKEILSIPCSSSKSERVFSTGGLVSFNLFIIVIILDKLCIMFM